MRVVGNDDDQRVVVVGREVLGDLHRIVEHDGVVDGTLPIERVAILVDEPRLDHQHKTVVVTRQDLQRGAHLPRQIGLIREFADRASLQELEVERPVHVAVVEQAEQLARIRPCRFGGKL